MPAYVLRRPLFARPKALAGALLLAGCMLANGAWAHAHLKAQTPAADSLVAAAPAQLQLQFSEGVEAAFSQVTLSDANGALVPLKALATSSDKKTLLATPVDLLPAGRYTVKWKVVSVDTHNSSGSYQFKVGQ